MTVLTPFADIEADMNRDTLGMLANAVATVVLPADVAGREIAVIFDDEYQFIDMGSGLSTSAPAATVLEDDMPEAMRDALEASEPVSLDIRSHRYTVVKDMPDGTGVTILSLRKGC